MPYIDLPRLVLLFVSKNKLPSYITPQTVGGIPSSIQHGRRVRTRNLPLPLMIGKWGWGVLTHVAIGKHTRICLLRNHSLWIWRTAEFYVRGITGWCWVESFQTQRGCWVEILGMRGCRVETVWGSKQTAEISHFGSLQTLYITTTERA